MMTILTFSSWTTFLGRTSLGEDSHIAPPYTNMGEALFEVSSLGHYLQIGGKIHAYDLFMMHILNLHFTTLYFFFTLQNDDVLNKDMKSHTIIFFFQLETNMWY